MELTKNAITILEKRYLVKNIHGGIIEEPEDMFRRVAKDIASADKLYGISEEEIEKTEEEFYEIMTNLYFLPNSPTLRGAGRELGQLSACFVLPIEDDLVSILDANKFGAMIHKTGGGTGYSFSKLRPKGDIVNSTGNVAGGPISFMKIFSTTTQEITQGGVRMGANMGVLSITHPDIMDFITCKNDNHSLTNFNISVAITDKFMEAVEDDKDWKLINPRNNQAVKKIKAKYIWDAIIENAWKNGDPGIIFIDRMNESNPTPELGRYEATNPCVDGNTLVAVADGRNYVSIKQLVEEGKDVPVYCYVKGEGIPTDHYGGMVTIKMGRNPRLTRKNTQTYKVTFDDKSYIIVTGDHKFIDIQGDKVETLNLQPGIFLMPFSEDQQPDSYRVSNIKDAGLRDVYNITVDDYHTIAYITKIANDNQLLSGIVTFQCGEQILLPYESCNLGSINLSNMLLFSYGRFEIWWNKLERTVRTAIHFLDNVIDRNKYVLPEIEEMTKGNRKVGLGVMGWADMLVQLGIPYNSEEALSLAKKVMEFIKRYADQTSKELAEQRGSFPNFANSIYNEYDPLESDAYIKAKDNWGIRNATRTTIAPTGTISMIANCSSGIEPLYSIVYLRETLFDNKGATEKLLVTNPYFESIAKERGFYSEELMKEIAENNGSVQNLEEVPEDIQELFKTAHDISPEDHVRMQASFQKYVDNAVSKTCNLNHSATKEDVERVFNLAYETGCKGITIYRDGSRNYQVLHTEDKKVEVEEKKFEDEIRDIKIDTRVGRPERTYGITDKVEMGCGRSLFVTVNSFKHNGEEYPCEVFINIGKSGGCLKALTEALGRIISIALQGGIDIKEITHQLLGIRCPSPKWRKGGLVYSCPDAIGQILDSLNGGNGHKDIDKGFSPQCPECGEILEKVEGCDICRNCGYSHCG